MMTDLDIDFNDDDIKTVEPFLIFVLLTASISVLYYVLQSKLGPEL
jgi:hypothetical protein